MITLRGSDATQESGKPAPFIILAPNFLLFYRGFSRLSSDLPTRKSLVILANRSLWRQIYLHTPTTLGPMREACVLARKVLDLCCSMAAPGITTDVIDEAAHEAIVEAGACPSPLNYNGFPKVIVDSPTLTILAQTASGQRAIYAPQELHTPPTL